MLKQACSIVSSNYSASVLQVHIASKMSTLPSNQRKSRLKWNTVPLVFSVQVTYLSLSFSFAYGIALYRVKLIFLNAVIIYVTLLHLRSKEPMRINKSYIPQSRDTTKCTPVYISDVSWGNCTNQTSTTFWSKTQVFDWPSLVH